MDDKLIYFPNYYKQLIRETKIRQWTLNNDKQNHPKISFVEKYEPNPNLTLS